MYQNANNKKKSQKNNAYLYLLKPSFLVCHLFSKKKKKKEKKER